jgi:hypothetical protein
MLLRNQLIESYAVFDFLREYHGSLITVPRYWGVPIGFSGGTLKSSAKFTL